jgi:uncharacterized secreted protein with C-terminal beta-propeller domain
MDEQGGVLRVVSQRGAAVDQHGAMRFGGLEVETFRIQEGQTFVPLGHLTSPLPPLETLRAVRFDGARVYASTHPAYVVTNPQVLHPLLVLDLLDPANPVLRGSPSLPGLLIHLQPQGDRLIGLGADIDDREGGLNLSLFDVHDSAAPTLLSRLAFGIPRRRTHTQIL